jgi:hypothetical protein
MAPASGHADAVCQQLRTDIADREAIAGVAIGPLFTAINGLRPQLCAMGDPGCGQLFIRFESFVC